MNRRAFVQSMTAAAVGVAASPGRVLATRKLNRIGLELYSVRHAMAKDPDRTLAAVRAIGYTDVELLWSFSNFGRSPQQVRDALALNGLRAPSAHMDPLAIFVGWERSLDIAKTLGQEYLIVPSFTNETTRTLDDWREWADHFNTAGAVARRHGIWLAFHNEAEHTKPLEGKIPYDVFVDRLDPSVVRLQLDTGNMLIGGGDPMAYLARYRDRYWTFHLKDVVTDKSQDTELGTGIFDFKRFLAAVPDADKKVFHVEQENGFDELTSARMDFDYLQKLDF